MKKKALISAAAAALAVCAAAGGTLAWLTDSSQEVKNTFTVGNNINIELWETGPDGCVPVASRNDYKMTPGVDLGKDPYVVVEADSETCWLFVEVLTENNSWTDGTVSGDYIEYTVDSSWTRLSSESDREVYYKPAPVQTSQSDLTFPVLKNNKVHVNDSVTKAAMIAAAENGSPALSFKAYAVQYNSPDIDTATEAWELIG